MQLAFFHPFFFAKWLLMPAIQILFFDRHKANSNSNHMWCWWCTHIHTYTHTHIHIHIHIHTHLHSYRHWGHRKSEYTVKCEVAMAFAAVTTKRHKETKRHPLAAPVLSWSLLHCSLRGSKCHREDITECKTRIHIYHIHTHWEGPQEQAGQGEWFYFLQEVKRDSYSSVVAIIIRLLILFAGKCDTASPLTLSHFLSVKSRSEVAATSPNRGHGSVTVVLPTGERECEPHPPKLAIIHQCIWYHTDDGSCLLFTMH